MNTLTPANPLEIHVVDDEEVIRLFVQQALEGRGYTLRFFDRAEGSLAAMEGKAPDLLLTDIMMPGMGGFPFAEKVLAQFPLTSVILLTGFSSTEKLLEALRLGVHEFLPKPFTVDELHQALERVLSRRRLFIENTRLKALLSLRQTLLQKFTAQLVSPLTRVRGFLEMAIEKLATEPTASPLDHLQSSLRASFDLDRAIRECLHLTALENAPEHYAEPVSRFPLRPLLLEIAGRDSPFWGHNKPRLTVEGEREVAGRPLNLKLLLESFLSAMVAFFSPSDLTLVCLEPQFPDHFLRVSLLGTGPVDFPGLDSDALGMGGKLASSLQVSLGIQISVTRMETSGWRADFVAVPPNPL